MLKPKNYIILVIVLLLLIFRLVPIKSQSGFVDTSVNGAVTCIGYKGPEIREFRAVTGGMKDFQEAKNRISATANSTAVCGLKPVTLKLYIL